MTMRFTKEFLDLEVSMAMPTDYSHVADQYTTDFVDSVTGVLDRHFDYTDVELMHHGIQGQKWGKRQYQNPDGSLTPLGRLRYGVGEARKAAGSAAGAARKAAGSAAGAAGNAIRKKVNPTTQELEDKLKKANEKAYRRQLKEQTKDAMRFAKGKKKRTSSMTETELDAEIRKLNKKEQLDNLRRETSTAYKTAQAGKSALNTGGKLAGKTLHALSVPGKFAINVAGSIAAREAQRAADKWIDNKFKEPESAADRRSKEMRRQAEDSRNGREYVKNVLEARAMSGDQDAAAKLRYYNTATKPNKSKK